MIAAIGTTNSSDGAGGAATPQPRLVRAAHEFEAQLMEELLKPMSEGGSILGDDDDSSSSAGGVLGQFASESLGKALSEHGGLGIANRIIAQLSPFGNESQVGKVTGK